MVLGFSLQSIIILSSFNHLRSSLVSLYFFYVFLTFFINLLTFIVIEVQFVQVEVSWTGKFNLFLDQMQLHAEKIKIVSSLNRQKSSIKLGIPALKVCQIFCNYLVPLKEVCRMSLYTETLQKRPCEFVLTPASI